jgi:hypothetical protein
MKLMTSPYPIKQIWSVRLRDFVKPGFNKVSQYMKPRVLAVRDRGICKDLYDLVSKLSGNGFHALYCLTDEVKDLVPTYLNDDVCAIPHSEMQQRVSK